MQPGDAGRPGDAAQPEDRQPLDVGAQPQPWDEPGVDARSRDTGHRGGQDQVHVGSGQADSGQGGRDGLLAELNGNLDERVVGSAEAVDRGVALDGQGEVPGLHSCR